jgi:hypothetical protein
MKETIKEWRGTIGAISGLVVGLVGAIGYFWSSAPAAVDTVIVVYCMAPEEERAELREKVDGRIVINCDVE